MNKTLYIFRHGTAVADNGSTPDIDRPIAPKGIEEVAQMGKKLFVEKHVPELIVASPAARAVHSALIFMRMAKIPYSLLAIDEKMYFAGTNSLLDMLKQTSDSYSSVMIVGHNPTFSQLAGYFLGDKLVQITTAGVVGLSFGPGKWDNLDGLKLDHHFYYFPGM